MFASLIAPKYAILVSRWSYEHFVKLIQFYLNDTINLRHLSVIPTKWRSHDDHRDSVTSLHPMYWLSTCMRDCVSLHFADRRQAAASHTLTVIAQVILRSNSSACVCVCVHSAWVDIAPQSRPLLTRYRYSYIGSLLCREFGLLCPVGYSVLSRVLAMAACPSVFCYKSEFYRNGWTNRLGFFACRLFRPISHGFIMKFRYLQTDSGLRKFRHGISSSKRVITLARESWTLRAW